MIIELPNGTELDAPDGLSPEQIKAIVQKHAGPARIGMGDVQASPSSYPDTSNVPAVMLTNDPATDLQIAQNLAAQGQRHAITKRDALGAGAVAAGTLVGAAAGVPAAIASGVLTSGGMRAQDPNAGGMDIAASGLLGGVVSGGLAKLLPYATGRLGDWVRSRLGAAEAQAQAQVAKGIDAEIRSETGRLGGMSQDLNRKIEWVIRLLDEEKAGVLTAENRALLEEFRRSPDFAGIVNKAAERVLEKSPGAVEAVSAQQAKLAALQETAPSRLAEGTVERLSPEEAKRQVWARLRRYGPPTIGSAIGAAIGGPAGVAVGALAGAGTRPAMHAMRRMATDPAVQTQLLTPLKDVGRGVVSKTGLVPSAIGEEVATAFSPKAPLRLGLAPAEDGTQESGAEAQAPPARQFGVTPALLGKMRSLPNGQGYADLLDRTMQKSGPSGAAQMHFLLYQKDPTYRQTWDAAQKPDQ